MTRGRRAFASVAVLFLCASCGSDQATSTVADTEDALVAKAREIVTAVIEERWEDARRDFDDTMRKRLTVNLLETSWEAYQKLFGEFRSQGDAEVVTSGSYKVVNIQLDMAKRKGEARVSFDEDEKVAGLFFLKTGVPVPDLRS